MGDLHHIGYRFYTARVAPRDWVYEEYLAEIDALETASLAQGGPRYVRYTRERFAETRARAIWGVPEPPPPPPTKAIEALQKAELFFAHKRFLTVLAVRKVQLAMQGPEDATPPCVQWTPVRCRKL